MKFLSLIIYEFEKFSTSLISVSSSIRLSFSLCIFLSRSHCLSFLVFVTISLSFPSSLFLDICDYFSLSLSLTLNLSVSLCLSVCLSVYMSVCLSVYHFLFLPLSLLSLFLSFSLCTNAFFSRISKIINSRLIYKKNSKTLIGTKSIVSCDLFKSSLPETTTFCNAKSRA
jgi:hypothetical protein